MSEIPPLDTYKNNNIILLGKPSMKRPYFLFIAIGILLILLIYFLFFFRTVCKYPIKDYGGEIIWENNSSYNLFINLKTIRGEYYDGSRDIVFIIDKNEKITLLHTFYGYEDEDRVKEADPVIFYTGIQFYNSENGNLINEFDINKEFFEKTEGSIELNNAVFQVVINDKLIKGKSNEK